MSEIRRNIYPNPQILEKKDGTLTLPCAPVILFECNHSEELFRTFAFFEKTVREEAGISLYMVPDYKGKLSPDIVFASDSSLAGEKYEIEISAEGISVRFGTPVGAFRAQTTLAQLLIMYGRELDCLFISDWPDLENRGFMLDISRKKVPKLEKLFRIVDMLSMVKANEFQLYLENFAVEYQAYPEYAHVIDSLTPFDLIRLTNYAKERYIKLVPNQNSFGHLATWLKREELKDLSLRPEGGGNTLNPIDPRSVELVSNLYDSLLPCFNTDRINIGCDEVGDLEGGKSAERAKEIGASGVYLEYLAKINDVVRSHGIRAQFWGDILLRYSDNPEILAKVPKDMIPLLWGYNGFDSFEPNAIAISSLGYDFYICPGTSSWPTIFPDIRNSNANVLDAARCAKKYGAIGMLMTDWGDNGHIQADHSMQLGMFYAAGCSWNLDGNADFERTCDFADYFIYKCTDDCRVTDVLRLASSVYEYESLAAASRKDLTTRPGDVDQTVEHYNHVKDVMKEVTAGVERFRSSAEDGEMLRDELRVAAVIYSYLADWQIMRIEFEQTGKVENRDERFVAMYATFETMQAEFHRCWNLRNKPIGNNHMLSKIKQGLINLENAVKGV